jgi:hypothetical protein
VEKTAQQVTPGIIAADRRVIMAAVFPSFIAEPRAGSAPMVRQPRRVDRQVVGKHRRARRCAVADIGVSAGAVGFARSQAEAVVGGVLS